MADYTVTAGGHTVSVTVSDAGQIAALHAEQARHNASLTVPEGESVEDHDDYCHGEGDYLNWVMRSWAQGNAGATEQNVRDTIGNALASYAGQNPPEVLVEPESGPPSVNALIAYAAQRRWEKEVGGITMSGVPVPTDDRAKLLLLGAAESMADGSSAPLVIGGVNYGTMSKAQFQAINAAVVAHVQSTFATLATVVAAISADPPTITDKAGIDGAFA